MRSTILVLFTLAVFTSLSFAQNASLSGTLKDGSNGDALSFANCVLYHAKDSSLVKVETTSDDGVFSFNGLSKGSYFLELSYVGFESMIMDNISLNTNEKKDLGELNLNSSSTELEQAVVTAQRALVEIKADRTVFNVQGTINSVGNNGLDLLRKAPGLVVDNNNNITVLGRSGVLIYVDGKRLPLSGDELTAYLQNLTAEQIDRIDIITSPGARYEAEGNAGIIDIRLKKSDDHGANGNLSNTASQGRYFRNNTTLSGNYKDRKLNAFGSVSSNLGSRYNHMKFNSYQNNINVYEVNNMIDEDENWNTRLGADYNIKGDHYIGFLVNYGMNNTDGIINNRSIINNQAFPDQVDSILQVTNVVDTESTQQTYNLNYRWDRKQSSLNIDLDYGTFDRSNLRSQPNLYYQADGKTPLSSIITEINTDSKIDISTFKIDYEKDFLGGRIGVGTKLSQVVTDNEFLFYNVDDGTPIRDNRRSNIFEYDEKVYAGYVEYKRPINEKLNFSGGLRMEITDAVGELMPFEEDLREDPVIQDYTNFFPSVGFSYQLNPVNVFALNYGSRINRPDYNVLNPFENQLSEISFEKGNAFLVPEIVHNIELGYTYQYRFNFKLAYSQTSDQITRLIGPDDRDPRAGFITWDNLAKQTVYNFNISAPFTVKEWWSLYMNINSSYIHNEADYPDRGKIDISVFNYTIFQQQTFQLGKGYSAELSGYYHGPGVWGGVFEYDGNWGLNIGLQKRFLQNRLNAKISATDLFYENGWSGTSNFNGLVSNGNGEWDSRRVSLSLSYSFGNSQLKIKKRKSGLEEESNRVGQ